MRAMIVGFVFLYSGLVCADGSFSSGFLNGMKARAMAEEQSRQNEEHRQKMELMRLEKERMELELSSQKERAEQQNRAQQTYPTDADRQAKKERDAQGVADAAHFREIYRVHPDYMAIGESQEFHMWLSKHPNVRQYRQLLFPERDNEGGTALEVNGILSEYKLFILALNACGQAPIATQAIIHQ